MTQTSVPLVLRTGSTLSPHHLELAAAPLEVELPDETMAAVQRGRAFVETCLRDGQPVYGSTTGFGPLVVFDGRDSSAEQCDNALQHLTVGQGPDLPTEVARATVLARLWSLSHGFSGVSGGVLHALRSMLRTSFSPAIPTLGSVGASGDLVPLAHVVQGLRGVGYSYVDGVRMRADVALARAGLDPLRLDGRDALGLVNGTSVTSALAGLAAASVRRSLHVAAGLAALLADLLGAKPAFLAPPLLAAFGHPEALAVGAALSSSLAGAVPSPDRPLQEPYSIRCTPQLLGAASSAVAWSSEIVGRDLNGVSDNPLFFPDENLVAHGGNFFGQPSAFAADLLSIVATQVGNLAERQIDLLVDPHRNGGRPPMLSMSPGRQHAIQGMQLLATAMVVAMRRACTPAAMQSVPTNLHNQDIVPFGTQGALTAFEQARSLRLLHGCLGVALRQAVHVGARKLTAPRCTDLAAALADQIAPIERDRPLEEDIRTAADVLDRYVAPDTTS